MFLLSKVCCFCFETPSCARWWQDGGERPSPGDADGDDDDDDEADGDASHFLSGDEDEHAPVADAVVDGSDDGLEDTVPEHPDQTAGCPIDETQPEEVEDQAVEPDTLVHLSGSDADGAAAMTSGLQRGSSCLDLGFPDSLPETQPDPVLTEEFQSEYDKYTVEDKKVDLCAPARSKGIVELPERTQEDTALHIKAVEIKLRELALLHQQLTLDMFKWLFYAVPIFLKSGHARITCSAEDGKATGSDAVQ